MSTAMAIVLQGGLHWLKPEAILAEVGSRAEEVECLGLKLCWEGQYPVPPWWMGGGAAPIPSLQGRAERYGGRRAPGLLSPMPSRSGLRGISSNCRDVYSGKWEVEELRQEGQAVLTEMVEVEHGEHARDVTHHTLLHHLSLRWLARIKVNFTYFSLIKVNICQTVGVKHILDYK